MKGTNIMNKIIKNKLIGLSAVVMLLLGLALFTPVIASVSAACPDGYTLQNGVDCVKIDGPTELFGPDGAFTKIINAALFLIGAVSVLMLVYGGIRYTISGGNATSVTAAKNTILYAIVGIVVAMLAYAIVNFVVGALA